MKKKKHQGQVIGTGEKIFNVTMIIVGILISLVVLYPIYYALIASLSKPTVSLVLGGSHSIGGPLAVSADYSFIVPSGTMIIHPVRSNGMFIGVIQSYRNMERTQDRIIRFLAGHSHMTQERIEELMLDSTQLVKDVGTLLEGEEAVKEGLIDAVGGMSDALTKLHEMIEEKMNKNR